MPSALLCPHGHRLELRANAAAPAFAAETDTVMKAGVTRRSVAR